MLKLAPMPPSPLPLTGEAEPDAVMRRNCLEVRQHLSRKRLDSSWLSLRSVVLRRVPNTTVPAHSAFPRGHIIAVLVGCGSFAARQICCFFRRVTVACRCESPGATCVCVLTRRGEASTTHCPGILRNMVGTPVVGVIVLDRPWATTTTANTELSDMEMNVDVSILY